MAKGSFGGNKKDNSNRKFSGGGPRPDHAKVKRAEAEQRNRDWASLSPQMQLADLDRRLGKDVGSVSQRKRIALAIARAENKASNASAAKPAKVSSAPEQLKEKDRRAQEKSQRPEK